MSDTATDALIRLGAPMPPEPKRWRPILSDANRHLSGGVRTLSEKDAKAAARMYRLLREALMALSIRAEQIDVKAFSGAGGDHVHKPRAMLCFHYCNKPYCSLPTVYARRLHNGAYADSRISVSLVFAERWMRDACVDAYPRWMTRLGSVATPTYPFPAILWPAIEPRHLTAAKAGALG